jgi:hypothetical protein
MKSSILSHTTVFRVSFSMFYSLEISPKIKRSNLQVRMKIHSLHRILSQSQRRVSLITFLVRSFEAEVNWLPVQSLFPTDIFSPILSMLSLFTLSLVEISSSRDDSLWDSRVLNSNLCNSALITVSMSFRFEGSSRTPLHLSSNSHESGSILHFLAVALSHYLCTSSDPFTPSSRMLL